jgi:hypothetical protein
MSDAPQQAVAPAAAPKKETENDKARRLGIPKAFRQYHARYGKAGVEAMEATHRQNPAPVLDHGRDRSEKAGTIFPCEICGGPVASAYAMFSGLCDDCSRVEGGLPAC